VGRVLLHLAIGFALWFAEIFAMVIILASTRNAAQLQHVQRGSRLQDVVGTASLMMLAAALVGWILFVYLRTSLAIRAAVLAVLSIGSVAVAVSRIAPLLPRV
jgi:hypothetical protein